MVVVASVCQSAYKATDNHRGCLPSWRSWAAFASSRGCGRRIHDIPNSFPKSFTSFVDLFFAPLLLGRFVTLWFHILEFAPHHRQTKMTHVAPSAVHASPVDMTLPSLICSLHRHCVHPPTLQTHPQPLSNHSSTAWPSLAQPLIRDLANLKLRH